MALNAVSNGRCGASTAPEAAEQPAKQPTAAPETSPAVIEPAPAAAAASEPAKILPSPSKPNAQMPAPTGHALGVTSVKADKTTKELAIEFDQHVIRLKDFVKLTQIEPMQVLLDTFD